MKSKLKQILRKASSLTLSALMLASLMPEQAFVSASAEENKVTLEGNETDGYYYNMPVVDEQTLILPDNFAGSTFKLYDNGGADGDYSNNTIDNLALLSAGEHESLHGENVSDDVKAMRTQVLRDNSDKAAEWHHSEEGRKWHSQNAKKQMAGLEFKTYTCQCCGKEFRSRAPQGGTFCGNSCKSKWRRQQGLDNVERVCAECGSKFVVNRYSKQKYCSRSCGAKHRRSQRGV